MSKILITGGYGKTSKRLAPKLHAAGASLVLSSRSGKVAAPFPHEVVTLNWDDSSTHEQILSSGIEKIWLVNPSEFLPTNTVRPFIDLAKAKGVKRIVLLSAAAYPDGSPGQGGIDQYLRDSGIDYAIVKPTWFMQNFIEERYFDMVKDHSKIVSATNGALVPWVSTEDIADVAVQALLAEKSPNADLVVRGPELLSYGDVARIFSEALGRQIDNVYASADDFIKYFTETFAVPLEVAKYIADLDTHIANGGEEHLDSVVESTTGHKPVSFTEFVQANKHLWQK